MTIPSALRCPQSGFFLRLLLLKPAVVVAFAGFAFNR